MSEGEDVDGVHEQDGPADRQGPSDQETRSAHAKRLEWHVGQIETALDETDTSRWEQVLIALRDSAGAIGADRIVATTSLLLTARTSDAHSALELLVRLRSEVRIAVLEEECRRNEAALAAELGILRPTDRPDGRDCA